MLGIGTYIVTGSSMEPGIHKGALVFVQPIDPSQVRLGDVITFQQYGQTTTHRVIAIGQYPADDLGAQLGCKRDQLGRLVIDEHNHTSVKNVYAAGDIAHAPQLAIVAASSGAVAAMAIHASLLPETRRLPSS